MLAASQPAVEGCGTRSMVSAAEAGFGRLRGVSAVNKDAQGAYGNDNPAAKSMPSCGAPQQITVAVNDILGSIRDGHRHTSVHQINVGDLRVANFRGFGDPESAHDNTESPPRSSICSRPIAWRLLLGVLSDDDAQWAPLLRQQRAQYNAWKREYMGPHRSSSQGEDINDTAQMKSIKKVKRDRIAAALPASR